MDEDRKLIVQAVQKIKPNASFSIGDTYETLNWYDEDQVKPTKAEFDTALVSVKSEHDALVYARNRQAEYPPMADQLDYIFHNGIDKWKEDIVQPVKDKYPKPE